MEPRWREDSAQYTADLIKALPSYQSIPKKQYSTRTNGEQNIPGSFEKFIQEKCDSEIKDETVPLYETAADIDGSREDALFGDEESAQIVLVGTSNATEPDPSYANFGGFLRAFLSADIYNASISGGGIYAPIVTYLRSDEYLTHKPKIIVWEIASHYKFHKDLFNDIFDESIPGAYGDCDGDAAFEKTFEGDEDIPFIEPLSSTTQHYAYLN